MRRSTRSVAHDNEPQCSLPDLIKETTGILQGEHGLSSILTPLLSKSAVEELLGATMELDSAAELRTQLLSALQDSQQEARELVIISQLRKCVSHWASIHSSSSSSSSSENGATFWSLAADAGLSYRELVALCLLLVQSNSDRPALQAAQLYLTLLQLPGSSNMFHALTLRGCMNLVKAWARARQQDLAEGTGAAKAQTQEGVDGIQDEDEEDEDEAAPQAKRKRAGRAKGSKGSDKKRTGSKGGNEGEENPFEEEDAAVQEEKELPLRTWMNQDGTHQMSVLLAAAAEALAVTVVPGNTEAYVHCVESLVDVTRTQHSPTQAREPELYPLHKRSPVGLCYVALSALQLPLHGDPAQLFARTAKHLLDNLSLRYLHSVGSVLPKQPSLTRNATLDFLIQQGQAQSQAQPPASGDGARDHNHDDYVMGRPLLSLLQHLCIRAPDKAVARASVVLCTGRLLKAFPWLAAAYARFLTKLATNAKASLRLLAVELAAEVMSQPGAFEGPSWQPPPTPRQAAQERAPQEEQDSTEDVKQGKQGQDGQDKEGQAEESADGKAQEQAGGKTAASGREKEDKEEDHTHFAQALFRLLLGRAADRSVKVRALALTSLAAALQHAKQSPVLAEEFTNLLAKEMQGRGAGPLATPFHAADASCNIGPKTPLLSLHKSVNKSSATPGPNSTVMSVDMSSTAQSTSMMHMRDESFLRTPRMTYQSSSRNQDEPVQPMRQHAGLERVLDVLHGRAGDERPVVRKAALEALEAVLLNAHQTTQCLTARDLQVFYDGCLDVSVAIRKRAVQALSRLLQQYPAETVLQQVWMGAVLPAVRDVESTVQEMVLKQFAELVLSPLCTLLARVHRLPSSRAVSRSNEQREQDEAEEEAALGAWAILGTDDDEMLQHMRTVLCLLSKRNELPTQLVSQLNRAAADSPDGRWANEPGLWFLLEVLSAKGQAQAGKVKVEGAVLAWNALAEDAGRQAVGVQAARVLAVLGNTATQLDTEAQATLAQFLFSSLVSSAADSQDFNPRLARTTIQVLHQLCAGLEQGQAEKAPAERQAPPAWQEELLAESQRVLQGFVVGGGETMPSPALVTRFLFLLGEVALHPSCPKPGHRLVTLVQSLLSPVLADISQMNLSQSSQSSNLSQDESVVAASSQPRQLPDQLRAHAFVALGKLCLADTSGALSKRCVTVLIRELETGGALVVQNNVLIVLCDLCRAFTQVVDRYVPSMADVMSSLSQLLRRHAFLVLTQLLREGYLKWKPVLFCRFASLLADDHANIVGLAERTLTSLFSVAGPGATGTSSVVHRHFMETIFFLNGCRLCMGDTGTAATVEPLDKRSLAFALIRSSADIRKRMHVYKFLLLQLSDEHKFDITARLCQDILGAVVEGALEISPLTSPALRDVLVILACPQLKLAAVRGGDALDEDAAPEASETASEAKSRLQQLARGKFLSKVVKKNTMENIVPILIGLKRRLAQHRSPLLRYLMLYLQDLHNSYKKELEEILAADSQLAAELEYDLRQFQAQSKEAQQRQELTRLLVTPLGASITPLTVRRQGRVQTEQIAASARRPGSGRGVIMPEQQLAASSPRGRLAFLSPRLRSQPPCSSTLKRSRPRQVLAARVGHSVAEDDNEAVTRTLFTGPSDMGPPPVPASRGARNNSSKRLSSSSSTSSLTSLICLPAPVASCNAAPWNVQLTPTPATDAEEGKEKGDGQDMENFSPANKKTGKQRGSNHNTQGKAKGARQSSRSSGKAKTHTPENAQPEEKAVLGQKRKTRSTRND